VYEALKQAIFPSFLCFFWEREEEEEEEHESAVEMWKCGGYFVRRLRVDGVDYRWSYSSYARTHPREQVAKGRN
jgi:hypothetical protein